MPHAFSAADRQTLLTIARRAIAARVLNAAQPVGSAEERQVPDHLKMTPTGVFVTVSVAGRLRGCIGHLESGEHLVPALVEAAAAACSRDPRFPPIRRGELDGLSIELSVLGSLEPVASLESIEIGRHGLVVDKDGRRGLLLPQVAVEHGWTPSTFVAHTCRKAGLADDAWPRGARLWRFEAEVFAESRGDPGSA